jgi:ubiquinol-cytochrome c reductase iron-sulfur subunit
VRPRAPRPGGGIALAFGASAAASVGLAVVYLFGGQVQLEGALLGIALGGIGAGLVVWAKEMMPSGPYVEERHGLTAPTERQRAEGFPSVEEVGRRRFLGRMLGAALGALGVAALFPIRSLGTAPGAVLTRTAWRDGLRLVTLDGSPVHVGRLLVGGVLTVFPEGHIGSADSQAVLIRVGDDELRLPEGRRDWAPGGFVAYSKICPHAGCPVGLYQAATHQLFCPCHQSAFDVLDGAEPTEGPATRPLPQLPLRIDDEGYLAAAGDFPEPVGPGYWTRPRA